MVARLIMPIDNHLTLSWEKLWLYLPPTLTLRVKGYGPSLDICLAREENLIAIDHNILTLMTILVHPLLIGLEGVTALSQPLTGSAVDDQ